RNSPACLFNFPNSDIAAIAKRLEHLTSRHTTLQMIDREVLGSGTVKNFCGDEAAVYQPNGPLDRTMPICPGSRKEFAVQRSAKRLCGGNLTKRTTALKVFT